MFTKYTASSGRKAVRCVSLVVFSRVPFKSYIAATEEQGTRISPFLFRNGAKFSEKGVVLIWGKSFGSFEFKIEPKSDIYVGVWNCWRKHPFKLVCPTSLLRNRYASSFRYQV